VIVTGPYVDRNQGWEFAKFAHTDPTSSFYLKVKEVEAVDGWAEVSGIVRVQVDGPVLDLKAGDYIQAYCWLDRFEGAANPGQFDVAKYLARRNVFIAASVPSRDAIEVLQGGSADFFVKMKRKAREIAVQSLLGSPYPQDENERLLQALVLGYRAEIDIATFEAFRKTGLLHFICLSGMNFGILIGVIWWLCKTAGLMKRGRAVVCMIAAAMFVLVIPSNPPAFRAAIICLVFCLSFFFRRQSNSFNSLALAAIILLMIKPTDLFDVSWQLSFASVLGILLFCQRILFFLYEKVTGRSWFADLTKTKPIFQIVPRPGPCALQLLSTSLAAWLASAGILPYNFYTVQPLTSIWTVIASPFIAVISFLGYLKLLIGLVLPTAASILDVIIKPLSDWLIWLVKYIAQIDFSQVLIGRVAIWLIVFYYCAILFIAFIRFKRPLVKKVISVLMVLAIIIFLGITKWQRTHRDSLTVTCLDVGHGQAILAQLPGGANILFDAGSLHKSDVGRRIVCPFLEYNGINEIDSIIISHNDVDHINGIPEIAEHCEVNDIYANESFFSNADQWGTAKFLKESLSKKGLETQLLGEELKLGSDARIKIIWPNEKICADSKLSDNDKSAVCLIEFAGRRILLCSDIEKFAQGELLRLYPNLKADVVIVPHHSLAKTLEGDFIGSLGADILICSCGRMEYEKQQLTEAKNNAKLFYTAEDGAITVRIDKDSTIEIATAAP
jgi:competence protein ComEC